MCRGTEVWYSLLWRGNKISLLLRIGAEGTLPVGGSRGLNLVFYPVGVLIEVFVCILILYPFDHCLEQKYNQNRWN